MRKTERLHATRLLVWPAQTRVDQRFQLNWPAAPGAAPSPHLAAAVGRLRIAWQLVHEGVGHVQVLEATKRRHASVKGRRMPAGKACCKKQQLAAAVPIQRW